MHSTRSRLIIRFLTLPNESMYKMERVSHLALCCCSGWHSICRLVRPLRECAVRGEERVGGSVVTAGARRPTLPRGPSGLHILPPVRRLKPNYTLNNTHKPHFTHQISITNLIGFILATICHFMIL